MFIMTLVNLINLLAQLLIWLIIIDSIMSFFVSPLHPARMALDRLVEPMLAPLRRVVPLVAGLDFSPLVLIILIQVLATASINLLLALRI